MTYICKKLIKLYQNSTKANVYVKKKSSVITSDLLGKTALIYNGRKWVKKQMDNHYLLGKPLGALRNVNSKVPSIYKSKKKKKAGNKKATPSVAKKKK